LSSRGISSATDQADLLSLKIGLHLLPELFDINVLPETVSNRFNNLNFFMEMAQRVRMEGTA
jgi:hypothetical protein